MRSSPCVLNHKPACQDNQDKKTTTVWPNVLLHVLHLFLFQSTCLKKSLNFTIFLWQRQGLRFSGAWTVPAKTLGIPSKKLAHVIITHQSWNDVKWFMVAQTLVTIVDMITVSILYQHYLAHTHTPIYIYCIHKDTSIISFSVIMRTKHTYMYVSVYIKKSSNNNKHNNNNNTKYTAISETFRVLINNHNNHIYIQ